MSSVRLTDNRHGAFHSFIFTFYGALTRPRSKLLLKVHLFGKWKLNIWRCARIFSGLLFSVFQCPFRRYGSCSLADDSGEATGLRVSKLVTCIPSDGCESLVTASVELHSEASCQRHSHYVEMAKFVPGYSSWLWSVQLNGGWCLQLMVTVQFLCSREQVTSVMSCFWYWSIRNWLSESDNYTDNQTNNKP